MQQHVDCTSFDWQLYKGLFRALPGAWIDENAVKAGSIQERVEQKGKGYYFALEAAFKWRALHLLQGAGKGCRQDDMHGICMCTLYVKHLWPSALEKSTE